MDKTDLFKEIHNNVIEKDFRNTSGWLTTLVSNVGQNKSTFIKDYIINLISSGNKVIRCVPKYEEGEIEELRIITRAKEVIKDKKRFLEFKNKMSVNYFWTYNLNRVFEISGSNKNTFINEDVVVFLEDFSILDNKENRLEEAKRLIELLKDFCYTTDNKAVIISGYNQNLRGQVSRDDVSNYFDNLSRASILNRESVRLFSLVEENKDLYTILNVKENIDFEIKKEMFHQTI